MGPPEEPVRRRVHATDPRPYPTHWGLSSPGTGQAATAAGPSLSGYREVAGPLASAATATGVNLAAQAPQGTTTRTPVPRPHLLSRERARARARARRPEGLSGARSIPRGRTPLGTPKQTTGEHAQQSPFWGRTPLFRAFPARCRAGDPTNRHWRWGYGPQKMRGKPKIGWRPTGAETCGLDRGSCSRSSKTSGWGT